MAHGNAERGDDPTVLNVEMVTLDMVLEPFTHVHLLDMDIQVPSPLPRALVPRTLIRSSHVMSLLDMDAVGACAGRGEACGGGGEAAARCEGAAAAHRHAPYHYPSGNTPSPEGGQLVDT